MGHSKLERFAQINTFSNVFQPDRLDVAGNTFELKGKWHTDYFKNTNPIIVEFGCGKGEYTVGLSQLVPEKNFIGVDVKGNRMWNGAKKSLENNYQNVGFVRTDIRECYKLFGKNEISEIWITFPDPQLRESRASKRLTHLEFLTRYKTFLQPDGIIHLKTDNEYLYTYTKQVLEEIGAEILVATDNLYKDSLATDPILSIKTYYEGLFTQKGFSICYLQFRLPHEI